MGKVWVLDTDTKGTGAQMVPLDRVLEKPEQKEDASRRRRRREAPAEQSGPAAPPPRRKPRRRGETTSSPLPAGHVRKKATGEIGRVRSVDPKAGTATVHWLKQGRSSTVPLTAISRR
jgi:hypothetical protein